MLPRPVVPPAAGCISVASRLESSLSAELLLRRALDVPASDPDHRYLASWIDRVGACDLAELTRSGLDLSSPAPDFSPPALSYVPFSPEVSSPTTFPHSPPPSQPGRCYAPVFTSPSQLLRLACFHQLNAWFVEELTDLLNIRDNPSNRTRPRPRALSEAFCFPPAARGCVWDLRSWEPGQRILPLNFLAPPMSRLDLRYLHSFLLRHEWPDKRLLQYLRQGVQFEADLPRRFVLLPHLESFPPGFASFQREIRRLSSPDLGWFALHPLPPFLPFWASPLGS